jgi:hypothetical protein
MLRAEIKVAEPTNAATASSTAYTPSSPTDAQSPSATQSSSTTTTPSSSLNVVSSATKLRTDAIAGIAVGGAVLIAIMGIIGRMCFRYRRRRSRKEAEAIGYPAYNTSMMPLGQGKSQQWSTMSPPTSGSELEYRPQRAELGGGRYAS